MEPLEMVLVRTNTTGNNPRFGVFTLLEETPEGWVLASEYGYDGVGTWFSPDNVIKRWVEKNDKFDHNAIPVGSLAVYAHRSYDPRTSQVNAEKFIGLVVEKKGAKYRLMRGDKIVSFPWQTVRPFSPAIDSE